METNYKAEKPTEGNPWDVIIIGSGPASFTAAVYTTRGAASTLILAGESWGGQLMLTSMVDNFPGFEKGIEGSGLMSKMKIQAERFGAEVVFEKALELISGDLFEVKTANSIFKSRSVIVATGASVKWLEAKGAQELIGRGVSSCAPCDAPFYKGKKVAVVGGGDSAMEEALLLTKYAENVIIIHRRDQLRASKAMQEKALNNPKIQVMWNSEIIEAIGNNTLQKLVIKNNKTGEMSELAIDGLFVAIGHTPETEIFKGLIEMDEKGYIKIKENSKTNIKGVFVAGDVHDREYKQAVTASGYGCMAGMEALKFLEEIR